MDFRKSKNKLLMPEESSNGSTNWLEDDEWQELKNQSDKRTRKAYDAGKDDEKVEFNIKLSLPKLGIDRLSGINKKIKKFLDSVLSKNTRTSGYNIKLVISIMLILVISVVGISTIKKDKQATNVAGTSVVNDGTTENLLPKEKPTYKILYPGNKDSETVGDIVKISPPGQAPAYTYVDVLASIQIQVTQQELPEAFKSNPESQLSALAKANYQNDIFQVDGVTVYSGKSTKGAQSLSFIKGNLLIFIKSANEITEESWVAYISALHS